jgi:hypothetical protein
MRQAVGDLRQAGHFFYGVWGTGVLVETLLERGADANGAGANGFTPLMAAAMTGCDREVIRLLIVAGAKVGDAHLRGEQEEHLADRLPGTSGTVILSEPVGDEVEVLLGFLPTFFDDALQGALVGGGFRFPGAGREGGFDDAGDACGQVACQRIERFLPIATIVDEARFAQERKVRRDARLRQSEDLLQFADREFPSLQELEHAGPGGVGHEAQGFPRVGHAGRLGCAGVRVKRGSPVAGASSQACWQVS